jgi:hypothetical protein
MKLKISAALICLSLAHPAAAQSVKTLAREYIALPAVQATLLEGQSPAFISGFVGADLPPGVKMNPAKQAAISKVVARHMAKIKPAMEKAMIEAAASSFTAEELKAMIAFANTKAGASSMRKGTIFIQRAGNAMAPTMQRTQAAMRPEIMKILVQ